MFWVIMLIPEKVKIQAVKELPQDCKGKCWVKPFFQIECECECYKENLERLVTEYKRDKNGC